MFKFVPISTSISICLFVLALEKVPCTTANESTEKSGEIQNFQNGSTAAYENSNWFLQGIVKRYFREQQIFPVNFKPAANDSMTCSSHPEYESRFDSIIIKNVVIAMGTFVSLKDALKSCFATNLPNLIKRNGAKAQKNLLIMSKHTVYIDTQMDSSINKEYSNVNLVIVATNWVVLKDVHKISLNGQPGKSHDRLKAIQRSNGVGEIGKPGLPGGNAGHFLGIGRNYAGRKLEIFVNGGVGGRGQDGGDGRKGEDGERVNVDKITFSVGNSWWRSDNKLLYPINITGDYGKSILRSSEHACLVSNVYYCVDFRFSGTMGKPGMEGGNGGNGGLGGYPGLVNVFGSQHFQNSFSVSKQNGISGMDGAKGKRGDFGRNGDVLTVRIDPYLSPNNPKQAIKGSGGGVVGYKEPNVYITNTKGQELPLPPNYNSTRFIQSRFVNIFRRYAINYII